MPKVSVIIPVYNVEQYLKECLDSVINQTLKDIEIICVNDSSTDNSLEILEKFSNNDERIKIISHENKGLSATRNVGIKNASGEYIFFLDSDDYIDAKILEYLVINAQETKADIICSNTIVFTKDQDNKIIEKKTNKLKKYFAAKSIVQQRKITIDNIEDGIEDFPVVVWGKLFSLSFVKKNNLFFTENRLHHEDDCFWLKTISCFPEISMIDKPGVHYRIRPNSIITTHKQNINTNHMKKILQDAFSFIENKYNEEQSKIIITKIKSSNTYCQYFALEIKHLINFIWGKNNKKIRIFDITLFKSQIKRGYLIKKILGVTIYKKKVI